MNMLIGLWFLVPNLATGYEYSYYQYNTVKEVNGTINLKIQNYYNFFQEKISFIENFPVH